MNHGDTEGRQIAGVDIGGTFTDFVLIDAAGTLRVHKRLSTPHDPSLAMLDGLHTLSSGALETLRTVAHGSTVATNAILERKGARAAFLASAGFRDLLFIGRQNRPPDQLYALQPTLPPPLIPRERCFDLPERLNHRAEVLTPLDLDALDVVLDSLAALDIESLAVCFLYSFLDPTHEQLVRERVRARGFDWDVALSSEVLPEFREYERASTTALEAYVRPVMRRYVDRLRAALPVPLRIMKSDGGIMRAEHISQQAVQTALSGPAAGVIAAHHLARLAGFESVITLDMGGTSTDVALIPGEPVRRPDSAIDGLPLRIRLLDIETVGAGGGSIARLDAGGALRVGPQSAGADPGPIVYGRGGTQVTVSDANAVLGRLDPERFLGGGMALDLAPAHDALTALGQAMGYKVQAEEHAALGVIAIANANIERAVRRVSVARGYDPRDFALLAFGGAGPLHACDVAERLGISTVIVPRHPGVLCALGLLVADVTHDLLRGRVARLDDSLMPTLHAEFSAMLTEAADALSADGFAPERQLMRPTLDLRYAGQAYELGVAYSSAMNADMLREAFHTAHAEAYGHAFTERAVEAAALRVQAVGVVDKPRIQPQPLTGGPVPGSRFQRDELRPGDSFRGPALVFQLDSTVFIPADWAARVDAYAHLVLRYDPG